MADLTALTDFAHHLPGLLAGVVRGMAQAGNPHEPWQDEGMPGQGSPFMREPAPLPIGAIVIGFLIGIGINILFGLWGKSRAEQYNVNPIIGFCLGFFLSWIGVALVPVFRVDRVINTRNQPQQAFVPHQQNPMYGSPAQYGGPPPPGYPPPPGHPQQYGAPPPMHGAPPPMQYPTQGPMLAGQGIAPPPPPPPQQPTMLQADAQGYVNCPHCAAKTKSGRKSCMSCGNFLPPVYDPNIR